MTEGRTPSAWVMCSCGAVVADSAGHQLWHDDLTGQLAALTDRLAEVETRLAGLLGGATPLDDGGLI